MRVKERDIWEEKIGFFVIYNKMEYCLVIKKNEVLIRVIS